MILAAFTGLTEHGGVQRYARHAAAVIAMVARQRGEQFHLLTLNDPAGPLEFESAGIRFCATGFARNRTALIRAILTKARETRLLYLNHPNLAPLGLALRALNPAARYVVSTHGFEVWEPLPTMRRFGLRCASKVTATAQFNAAKAVRIQGITSDKVVLIPCALDPEFSAANGAEHRSSDEGKPPMLLTVARLMSAAHGVYKGIDTVIEALPGVLGSHPGLLYVVVGSGDDLPRLQTLANRTGVATSVKFTGAVDSAVLREYLAASDVFVMPSRTEGFGFVFLEAMAFGKPVIGGNHGGTPEIWPDGSAGFLVDYSDLRTLADRLKMLLADSDLRRRMGVEGRRRVAEFFSFDRFRENFAPLFA